MNIRTIMLSMWCIAGLTLPTVSKPLLDHHIVTIESNDFKTIAAIAAAIAAAIGIGAYFGTTIAHKENQEKRVDLGRWFIASHVRDVLISLTSIAIWKRKAHKHTGYMKNLAYLFDWWFFIDNVK